MKKFILLSFMTGIIALAGSAHADSLAKCTISKKFSSFTGVNVWMKSGNSASIYLFPRSTSKIRMEGSFHQYTAVENSYYGNDLSKPAGSEAVKKIRVASNDEGYNLTLNMTLRGRDSASADINVSQNGEQVLNTVMVHCDISQL